MNILRSSSNNSLLPFGLFVMLRIWLVIIALRGQRKLKITYFSRALKAKILLGSGTSYFQIEIIPELSESLWEL